MDGSSLYLVEWSPTGCLDRNALTGLVDYNENTGRYQLTA